MVDFHPLVPSTEFMCGLGHNILSITRKHILMVWGSCWRCLESKNRTKPALELKNWKSSSPVLP